MLPEAATEAEAEAEATLQGDFLKNVSEVINIMSALFHDSEAPQVALAEIINSSEMRELNGGELVDLFDKPRWSLAHGFQIEDYGKAQIYLGAR